jgi:hypothetical protein
MRWALVILTLLGSTGCASWFHARIPPASTPAASAAGAAFWSAAFDELQARGFRIASHDPENGTLRTDALVMPGRVPCGFLKCGYRDTVHVAVAPQGEVSVRIQRELSTFWLAAVPVGGVVGGTSWQPPASTQRATVAGVVADQDTLLRAILERATDPGAGSSGQ